MAQQNGVPTGGHYPDVRLIRAAITDEWNYRMDHQISASPSDHIEALSVAVLGALMPRPKLPNGLCGVKPDHLPHSVHTGSLAPFFCTADQSQREPGRSERRRLENRGSLEA